MELMQTESQFKEIQPFLSGRQREVGTRHIRGILPNHSAAEREFANLWSRTLKPPHLVATIEVSCQQVLRPEANNPHQFNKP